MLDLQAKLEAAVKAAEQFNAEAVETDERKRKYNAAAGGSANGDAEPTPGVDGGFCRVLRCRTPTCLFRPVCPVQLTSVSRPVGHCPVVLLQRRWRRTA